jgi:hypothetical protein
MKMAWEGLMKAKKLPLRRLLMVMVGRAQLKAYRARLESYQKKLEPARGVSRIRLGSYQGPWSIFPREPPTEVFFDHDPYSYQTMILIRMRIGA